MKPYYSADGVEIYQGDNREVLPALISAGVYRVEDVALLWGDPPYGVAERTDRANKGRGRCKGDDRHNWSSRDWQPVAGDDAPFDPAPRLAIYKRVALWGGNHFADRLPPSPSWWTWDKRRGVASDDNADCEHAWTNLGGPARLFSHLWRGYARDSEVGERVIHPTQKPVALARWGFERAKLQPGDLVLSPWLGSGPEAVAARDMGLRFIGVELDRGADGKPLGYLDACVARLRQRPLLTVARLPEPEQAELLGDT